MPNSSRRAPALKYLAMLFALVLLVAACGGGSDKKSSSGGGGGSGGGSEGTPVEGGKITYGLDAKTTTFCLPVAQLAIAGILVVESVYDTLMRPTQDNPNTYVPYLAKSVDHNADYTQWTIVNRSGVTFQDGTPLTADIVKQNIDAWRSGVLLGFVFQNIASTAVTAPDTVVVTMKTPWVAFPAYLWSTGRTGIAAPAQLDDQNTCDTNMIGTGPFKLKSFDPNTGDVSVTKNPTYWRKDSAGRQLPYLDEIDFKPQEESGQRVNGLQGGQYDVIMDSSGLDLDKVQKMGNGITAVTEPPGRTEIGHALPNVSKPPFDKLVCRQAIAEGTDKNAINQIANKGLFRLSDSVFDTQVMGYVKDPGYPKYNQTNAKNLADQCKQQNGGKFEFQLQSTFDQQTQAIAAEVQRQMRQIGVTVDLPQPVDQATIISKAVGSAVDSFLWRNYPGQDPDTMYVWFHSGSTVNFNHINDPTIDQALETGRTSSDAATRKKAYETFNKRMSSQAYNFWNWYTTWFLGIHSNVHGYLGPNLPDASGKPGNQKPADLLAGYHQMLGIWVK